MKLLCPAKINWTLNVLGRRNDGFHQLQSWFVGISLCDELACEIGGAGLAVFGDPQTPSDADNLVLQAEKAWRAAGGQAPEIGWALNKGIPMSAGLGGGSSDAAGALRILEEIATSPLGASKCHEVALSLGSDVPFFLDGCGWQLRGGRGERVLCDATGRTEHLVIALPGLPVATTEVYKSLSEQPLVADDASLEFSASPPAIPGPNELHPAALQVEARLEQFAQHLSRHANFQLSGSGGAHFLAVEDAALAHLIASALSDEGITAYPARTLEPHELLIEALA